MYLNVISNHFCTAFDDARSTRIESNVVFNHEAVSYLIFQIHSKHKLEHILNLLEN